VVKSCRRIPCDSRVLGGKKFRGWPKILLTTSRLSDSVHVYRTHTALTAGLVRFVALDAKCAALETSAKTIRKMPLSKPKLSDFCHTTSPLHIGNPRSTGHAIVTKPRTFALLHRFQEIATKPKPLPPTNFQKSRTKPRGQKSHQSCPSCPLL
jgi:hypothetical protein